MPKLNRKIADQNPKKGVKKGKKKKEVYRAKTPAQTLQKEVTSRQRSPRAQRPTAKPKAAPKAPSPALNITKCALDYFKVLYNPFELNVNPCIPGITPTPSLKFKVTTRGTFQVGTQGAGGIAFWPARMLSSALIRNKPYSHYAPAVVVTNSTYDQVDFRFTNYSQFSVNDPMWTQLPGSTSMFLGKDLGAYTAPDTTTKSLRTAKLVGGGIRVQYADKVFDMSGNYIIWRNPNPTSALPTDKDNVADLLAINAAAMQRVNGDWVGVTYIPKLETDLSGVTEPCHYLAEADEDPASIKNRLACGVFISNAQASQRFEFEAVAFFELAGQGIPVDQSHSDPNALGAILAINTPVVNPNLNKAESTAWSALRAAATHIGYAGVRVMGETVRDGMLGMMGFPRRG